MNSCQVPARSRSGAGSTPWRLSTLATVPALLLGQPRAPAAVLFVALAQHARLGGQVVDDVQESTFGVAPHETEQQA